jgi:hypothetical protein
VGEGLKRGRKVRNPRETGHGDRGKREKNQDFGYYPKNWIFLHSSRIWLIVNVFILNKL